MRILGISAFYHDSAAALIEDGDIVAAAQEERFTRKKHDPGFPRHAIDFVLREGGTGLQDVDYVVFYEKPFLKFERLLETYLAFAPKGFASFAKAMPVWLREKLFQKNLLKDDLRPFLGDFGQKGFGQKDFDQKDFDWDKRLLFTEHHVSHAASAFYPSPFGEAAVLTLDGVGEWATTTAGIGQGRKLEITREIHFPHSLGLLYSALTYHLGFKVNSGEYKIMGLAAYGEPKYAQLMLD
jgi:carbamoyltransferase